MVLVVTAHASLLTFAFRPMATLFLGNFSSLPTGILACNVRVRSLSILKEVTTVSILYEQSLSIP